MPVRAPVVRPTKRSPAFGPLSGQAKPFAKAQRKAAHRTQRARRKLPDNPRLPRVPFIPPSQMTPQQRASVVAGIHAAVNRERRKGGHRSVMEFYDQASPRDRKLIRYATELQSAPYVFRGPQGLPYSESAASFRARPGDAVAVPGPQRRHKVGIGPATITVNPHAALGAIAAATSLGGNSPENRFVKAALGDVKTLGTSPFIGGYEVGAGAYEAVAHGDTSRLKRLAEGVGEYVVQEVKHPVKSFREHPILTGLDVSAVGSVVGHGAGAIARATGGRVTDAGLRGSLARAGSTERSPLALTDEAGSRLIHERRHSRDLIRKGAERQADARRKPLRDSEGNVVMHKLPSGREVPVLRASNTELPVRSQRQRLQDARTDYIASRTNSTNRLTRERAARDMRRLSPSYRHLKHRADRDIVPLALEGTIRSRATALADLRAHRARIAAVVDKAEAELRSAKQRGESKQSVYRTKVELAAAKERLRVIDKFLESKPSAARIDAILKSRAEIGKRLNDNDLAMAQAGLGSLHQLRRSRLFPYAQEHLGAVHAEDAAGNAALRHPDGRFMSNAEIETHMQASGLDPAHVAYLPHRSDVRGARAYYSQFRGGGRPAVKNEPRTGRLYERGATGTTFDTAAEHAVRQETQLAKAHAVDRFVHDTGLKRDDGRYFTAKEARETADRLAKDTGEEWTPISAVPAKLDRDTMEAVKQGQDPRQLEGLSEKLINSRIEFAKNSGKRNVVLVPKRMVDRLADHAAPAGGVERIIQYLNRPFRFTVLAQPRWLTGNFVEPYLVRLPTVGSGIIVPGLMADLRAFHKVLGKERTVGGRRVTKAGAMRTDPKLARVADEIEAEHLGGLFVGNRGASNRRTLDDVAGVARYGKTIARLPVARQMAWFGKHAATIVGHGFFAANRILEAQVQKAALGHQIRREVQEFSGSWTKALAMTDDVAKEMARGLVNTATQQRFAHDMDVLLGKYARWSPTSRRLIQSVFPFVPWSLAAARFVYWTLPAHNSAKTALLIKAAAVEQRAWDDAHADTPPWAGDLKYALRTKDGGYVDVARYTPFSLSIPFSQGDFSGLQEPLLPQLSGVTKALAGQDPFGKELKDSQGRTGKDTDTFAIALNQLLESVGGPLSTVRRLREGGGTPFADSTVLSPRVKPGSSHMSAARRTFDPFRPTYLKSPGGAVASDKPAKREKMSRSEELLMQAAERSGGGALSDEQVRLLTQAAARGN